MADADKRALELTLAIAGLDENTRQSAMRVRGRAFDEAGARTANWDALDEAARSGVIYDLKPVWKSLNVDPTKN